MSILSSWLHDVGAMLFPPTCAVCGRALVRGERMICTPCRASAPLTEYWRRSENPLARRFYGLLPIVEASAFLFYRRGSLCRRPILAFKYRKQWRLAQELGRWYGAELAASGLYDGIEVVIPLPLHPLKQLLRGYNQTACLAEGIAEALGATVDRRALRRVRYTRTQARLSQRDRDRNVAGAFRVKAPERLQGRHLLLVDDVLTTGSTLLAAGEAIVQAVPDCRISIATLCLTDNLY